MAITHIGRLFRARIDEEIRRQERLLWEGGGTEDLGQYRFQAGFIAGMNAAIMILEELEKE